MFRGIGQGGTGVPQVDGLSFPVPMQSMVRPGAHHASGQGHRLGLHMGSEGLTAAQLVPGPSGSGFSAAYAPGGPHGGHLYSQGAVGMSTMPASSRPPSRLSLSPGRDGSTQQL